METGARVPQQKDHLEGKLELGKHAVWSLSSAKPNFGVQQLRDQNMDTYWQSDGLHPHHINAQFHKRTFVSDVRLYCDYRKDESYTPSRISLHIGSSFHDLHQIQSIELSDPHGWITISLKDEQGLPICANLIQIAIEAMNQNGKDTHVRQVQIWGPRESSLLTQVFPTFQSPEFFQYSTIR